MKWVKNVGNDHQLSTARVKFFNQTAFFANCNIHPYLTWECILLSPYDFWNGFSSAEFSTKLSNFSKKKTDKNQVTLTEVLLCFQFVKVALMQCYRWASIIFSRSVSNRVNEQFFSRQIEQLAPFHFEFEFFTRLFIWGGLFFSIPWTKKFPNTVVIG